MTNENIFSFTGNINGFGNIFKDTWGLEFTSDDIEGKSLIKWFDAKKVKISIEVIEQ